MSVSMRPHGVTKPLCRHPRLISVVTDALHIHSWHEIVLRNEPTQGPDCLHSVLKLKFVLSPALVTSSWDIS